MFIKPVKEANGYQIYFKFETIPTDIKGAIINFAIKGALPVQIPVYKPPVNFFEDMIRFAANDIDWNAFFWADPKKMEGVTLKKEIIRIFSEIKSKLP